MHTHVHVQAHTHTHTLTLTLQGHPIHLAGNTVVNLLTAGK